MIISLPALKKIIGYLKNYFTKEVNKTYLVLIIGLNALFIYLNYEYRIPKNWINDSNNFWESFYRHFVFYFASILYPFIILYIFDRDPKFYTKKLWTIIAIGCAIFALRSSFTYHNKLISEWLKDNQELKSLAYNCFDNLVMCLITIVPVFIIWMIWHRRQMPFYGFSTKNFEAKPYWILLLLMVPLIVWASFQTDFLQQYPKVYGIFHYNNLNSENWKSVALFELCYGIDFISIESFFRGFMILLLGRIIGYKCIIPIACFYVGIHFWKPMAETASSFFGGMLLGVLALETKSIYGGIMVHLGIAWLMEVGAIIVTSIK